MTSRDQFEVWAAEHLPTLYLTKTEQGTYESTATGNFFAAWSARDGEIEALRASNHTIECRFEVSEDTLKTIRGCLASAERDIDQLKAGNSRLQGELHAGSDLIATCRRVNREIRSDCDQLKATVSDYEMGLEAAKEEIARLKADLAAELQRRWDGNEASAREHDEEVRKLKGENEGLLTALKGMTSMYGYCWDLVDGGLLCMQQNVQRFEDAHEAAQKVIAAMSREASDE